MPEGPEQFLGEKQEKSSPSWWNTQTALGRGQQVTFTAADVQPAL
jgi:hypothetical protein